MDAWWRLTDVFSEGSAPKFSLVDPRAIYVVALTMVEIFLGVSNSGWWECIEEMLPSRVPELQESKIAVSEAPGGRGGPPPLFTSQLRSVWRERSMFASHNGWRGTSNEHRL
jgi:hypothetical protein